MLPKIDVDILDLMNTRAEIEQDIWDKASVNREHLLAFMRLIPTSDSQAIQVSVKQWLQRLHDDPHFSKVSFPQMDSNDAGMAPNVLERILTDLSSYGHVTQETVIGADPNIMPGSSNVDTQ